MKKLLLIIVIACFWGGGSEVWNALFHGKPVVVEFTTNATPDLPAYFTLTKFSVDPLDAIYVEQTGTRKALLPVRPAGAKDDAPIHVLLVSTDPELLKLKDAPEPAKITVEVLKHVLEVSKTWKAKTQIVGTSDRHSMRDKQRQQLMKVQTNLAADFVVITEGPGPSIGFGLFMLAAGVGFTALFLFLTRDRQPAPAAGAEPPKLPTVS